MNEKKLFLKLFMIFFHVSLDWLIDPRIQIKLNTVKYSLILETRKQNHPTLMAYLFLKSCSGSEAQVKKDTTSLASWLCVAGVPVGSKNTKIIADAESGGFVIKLFHVIRCLYTS